MQSKKEVEVLSFGGGIQTIALLVASLSGDYHKKPDFCVFGDPGWEHPDTYSAVGWYSKWASDRGVEVLTSTNGNILIDPTTPGTRSPTLPLFTEDGTMLKDGTLDQGRLLRQCTYEYKISVVGKVARQHLGYAKGTIVKDHHVNMWLGISIDEAHRMKPSKIHWQTAVWPLIEMKWSRSTCVDYLKKKGMPVPPKSACIGCPFHNNAYWRNLKKNDPDLWEQACKWDEDVRRVAPTKKLKSRVYVHRSLKPLREAPLEEDVADLFGEECAGYCGT